MKKARAIKAWGLVNEHGLTWGNVLPVNGKHGSGLSFPNISTNREEIATWKLDYGESIVDVSIVYKMP